MRIGVVFPQLEIGTDPAGIRAYAQAAQDLGYQHLLAFDHVLGADPAAHPEVPRFAYTHQSLFHEPFVLFGFLAAAAPRLELVTGVIILPQRQTALVAKQAAEVDVLTGGKTRLGVGLGWNPVEYEALGMDFKNRARRFEEQITLLRRLWQEPVLNFAGRYHTVTAAGLNPLPVQRPIPIWIGARAEPALKRAAEIGDGYLAREPFDEQRLPTLEKMREWRRAAGRDPSTFGFEARIQCGTGTPDDWRRAFEVSRKYGATHVEVNTMGGGFQGPDAHIQRIKEARAALG